MKCSVYINQSIKSGRYYIGTSIKPFNRLAEHNSGKVKATRNMRPWVQKFSQEYNTIKQARQVEYRLKKLKRKDIVERIIKDQEIKLK